MDLITVYDCMGSNLPSLTYPAGVKLAGYVTGSGGVPWTPAQFAAHPDAIRIDQSPINTTADETADIYDMETNAGTLAGLGQWANAARNAFSAKVRPGQRTPLVYMSKSNVTPVANALTTAGILSGVGLWLAAEMTPAAAAQLVQAASGPYPIIGVQFAFLGTYDVSCFNAAWFANRSGQAPAAVPKPGAQSGWRYCNKCTGLFFGPQAAESYCPAGGRHDGIKSHSYDLPFLA